MLSNIELGELYKIHFETSSEGLVLVNKDGEILIANEALNKLFGYNSQELIGEKIEILIPTKHKEKHKQHRQHYTKKPQKRAMGQGFDLVGIKKDGTEFFVEISLNYFKRNDDTYVLALVNDITPRKKIEDKLRDHNQELERLVEERTKELDNTVKALEFSNESLQEEIEVRKKIEDKIQKALSREKELNDLKSRFVSMASHEFRTPLSTIMSSISLIGKYDDSNIEKRERHIDKIKSSVRNLTNILDDFLSIDRLEAGKAELNIQEINLINVCEQTIDLMNSLLKNGQEIRLMAKSKDIGIISDGGIIQNVLTNLLSNAIKYSDVGDIIVEVQEAKPNSTTISVHDNGIGIADEEQKHMFERFFRAKNAINIQGTGLGLNIVKRYADMLRGEVTFHSKLNVGSTFILTLPQKINQ